MRRSVCAVALFALAAGTAPAQAQSVGTSPEVPYVRRGLLIGFGVGGGNIQAECDTAEGNLCDEVLESGSVHFHVGGMLKPNLGIMLDVWPMVYHEDFLTIVHTITTGAVQFWVTPRLWLKGGLGVARAEFHWDGIFVEEDVQTDTVPAAMAAIGYEFLVKRNFVMDVGFRAGTGNYEDDGAKGHSFALEVGFNWY